MVKIILYGFHGNGNIDAIAGYPYQIYKLTLNELPHINEWFHLKVNNRVAATIFIDVNLTWIKERPKIEGSLFDDGKRVRPEKFYSPNKISWQSMGSDNNST